MMKKLTPVLLFAFLILLGASDAQRPRNGGSSSSTTISDVTLLLPLVPKHLVPIRYKLEAYNGCFRWSSTNPDLIRVETLYDQKSQCSTAAWVEVADHSIREAPTIMESSGSSQPSQPSATKPEESKLQQISQRNSAWVVAHEINSGIELRCEVFVDVIDKIEIATKTQVIYKEHSELLTILAYDSQKNTFSTVEGLQFQWTIQQSSSILKMVHFRDSNVEVTSPRRTLEDSGKQSDFILVEGVELGKVMLTAVLTEPFYTPKRIASSVPLTVMENMYLDPSMAVWITPGTELIYHLNSHGRDKTPTRVDLRYRKFNWDLSDKNAASASQVEDYWLIQGKATGKTTLTISHPQMEQNRAQAIVNVALPASIGLSIVPSFNGNKNDPYFQDVVNNWHLTRGHQYNLTINMYSENKQILMNPDFAEFEIVISSEYFDSTRFVIPYTVAGSHMVIPIKSGVSQISAALLSLRNKKTGFTYRFPQRIEARQEATIFDPVNINIPEPFASATTKMRKVFLPYFPWSPSTRHSANLKCRGGSGEYTWETEDPNIVLVTHGTVTSLAKGFANVTCRCKRNPNNYDTIRVVVQEAAEIEFYEGLVETQIGHSVLAHTRLLVFDEEDRKKKPFLTCENAPIQWRVESHEIFSLLDDRDGVKKQNELEKQLELTEVGICSSRVLLGLREGSSLVTAVLQSSSMMSASQGFYCFPPLKLASPSEGDSVLVTPASSWVFSFVGGPRPWHPDPSAFYTNLVPAHTEKDDLLFLTEKSPVAMGSATTSNNLISIAPDGAGYYNFRVTCLDYGEHVLRVVVGNRKSVGHAHPVGARATVKFLCQKPQGLYVLPIHDPPLPAKDVPSSCVDTIFPSPSMMEKEKDMRYLPNKFRVLNDRDYPFVLYAFANNRAFDNFSSVEVTYNSPGGFQVESGRDYRSGLLKTPKKQESVLLQVRAAGYLFKALASAQSRVTGVFPIPLEANTDFNLVAPMKFAQAKYLLYNHANNHQLISVQGGSGEFRFQSENPEVVGLRSDMSSHTMQIQPLSSGMNVKIIGYDLCFPHSGRVDAFVTVTEVAALALRVLDSVKQGETTPMLVQALDISGTPFSADQYNFIPISVRLGNEIVSVTESTKYSGPNSNFYCREEPCAGKWFSVRGDQIGIGKVSAYTMTRNGAAVASRVGEIQVFSPFRIIPPKLILVPGNMYQMQWTGGPTLRSKVEFAVENTSVATIDSRGTLLARAVGRVTLKGTIFAEESLSGKMIEYGRDYSEVWVQSITGIIIQTPSSKILVGNEITLHVVGTSGENPFSFEYSMISFSWETSDKNSMQLLPVYVSANRSFTEHSFTIRSFAKAPGSYRVSVKISACPSCRNLEGMSASTIINVVEPLQLLSPAVLMTPFSSLTIKTNKDSNPNLLSFEPLCSTNLFDVSRTGVVRAAHSTGTGYVLVRWEGEIPSSEVLKISVKPIHHLQAVSSSADTQRISVGSNQKFDVVFRDEHGTYFDAISGFSVQTEQSRSDIFSSSVNGNHLAIKALQGGTGVIKVSLNNSVSPALEAFLPVSSSDVIYPADPVLHVGAVLTFRGTWKQHIDAVTGVTKPTGDTSGPYKLDNCRGILELLDSHSGIVRAVGQGRCKIIRNMGDTQGSSDVIVTRVGKVSASKLPVNGNNYPLTFVAENSDHILEDYTSAETFLSHNVWVDCSVAEGEWASAKAEVVQQSQSFKKMCVLTSKHKSGKAPQELHLKVSAGDISRSYVVSGSVPIAFTKSFTIRNMDGRTLLFTPSTMTHNVEIVGKVDGHSVSDNAALSVKKGGQAEGTTWYELTVKQPFTNLTIEFFNQETGQNEVVMCLYSDSCNGFFECFAESIQNFDNLASVFIFVLLLLAAVVLLYFIFTMSTTPQPPSIRSPPRLNTTNNNNFNNSNFLGNPSKTPGTGIRPTTPSTGIFRVPESHSPYDQ